MGEDRFWALIALLDGVATDRSVAGLDATLASSGEGTDFAERVGDAVERLVGACSTTDLVAAAVVARGRTHYEAVLSAVGEVDPDAYDWEDAEALLVAGAGEPVTAAPEDTAPGPVLRWEASAPSDDTAAWHEAVRRVIADPELSGRLRAVGTDVGLELLVSVRDVEEPDWRVSSQPRRLELVVPAADLAGLTEEDRAEVYGEIVGALVIRAEELAGRPEQP